MQQQPRGHAAAKDGEERLTFQAYSYLRRYSSKHRMISAEPCFEADKHQISITRVVAEWVPVGEECPRELTFRFIDSINRDGRVEPPISVPQATWDIDLDLDTWKVQISNSGRCGTGVVCLGPSRVKHVGKNNKLSKHETRVIKQAGKGNTMVMPTYTVRRYSGHKDGIDGGHWYCAT